MYLGEPYSEGDWCHLSVRLPSETGTRRFSEGRELQITEIHSDIVYLMDEDGLASPVCKETFDSHIEIGEIELFT